MSGLWRVQNAPLSVFMKHCHLFAKTQTMHNNEKKKRDMPTWSKWNDVQIRARLISRSNFSSASQGRFLFKGVIFSDGRLASRSCSAATLIPWNARAGTQGSKIAKALTGLLKQSHVPTVCLWHRNCSRKRSPVKQHR